MGDGRDTHGMEIGENFQDMAYGMLTCQSLLAFCQQKKECSNFSLTKQNKSPTRSSLYLALALCGDLNILSTERLATAMYDRQLGMYV